MSNLPERTLPMNEQADPIDTEEIVIVAFRGDAVRFVNYKQYFLQEQQRKKTSSIEEAVSFYRQMLMQPEISVISTRKGER